MLQVTDVYLERLMLLRDVGIPLAREMEEKGRLDFDEFMSECGTYRCLAGWCGTREAFVARGFILSANGQPYYNGAYHFNAIEEFFGVDRVLALSLFGNNAQGTLSDRAAYLDKLIEERAKMLEAA